MSETNLITLADIRAIPELNEAMVKPGDTYTIGEDGGWDITRVWSEPNEKLDLGIEITQEHLDNQPELVDRFGIEVGDRYIESENKFIKTGANSGWKQFMYGFDEEPTLLDNVSNVAESWLDDIGIDIGRFDLFTDEGILDYKNPEEIYGPEWHDADSATQRAMIRAYDERRLLDHYGRYFEPDDSVARTIGQIGGTLADPFTAIPIGGALTKGLTIGQKALQVGKAMGAGGALGGSYSISEDLAKGGTWGDIDWEKAAITTGASAGAVGALSGVGAGVSKLRAIKKDKAALRDANRIVDDAQESANRQISSGVNPGYINQSLARTTLQQKRSQGGPSSLAEAERIAGRTVSIPGSGSAAQQMLRDAAEDQTVARWRSKGLDDFFGSISTRIRSIPAAEPIFMRLRKFEFDTRVKTGEYLQEVESFGKHLKKFKGQAKNTLTRHLDNGEFDKAKAMMPKQMQEEFGKVVKVLDDLGHGLKAAGIQVGIRPNYFPRLIKNERSYEKLLKHIGAERKSEINKILREQVGKLGLQNISEIPTWRRYELINQYMRGYRKAVDTSGGRITKSRKIDRVTDDMLPYYASPEHALNMYVRNAVNSIERAKFFGLHQKGKGYRGLQASKNAQEKDIESSIGELTERYMRKDADGIEEVKDLLKSRFTGGEQSSNKYFIGELRDLGYMGTIANPISAVTQLGDIGVSGALHGFRNTLAGMFGKKYVKLIDIGLTDVGQEMAERRATADALRKVFKWSGFRKVDELGKVTSMNAALRKNFNAVKTEKGEAAFRKKWGKAYADDIDNVVADLKSGRVTERVKFHAFNELSDMQPISMMEMPQKYIDHPNGRILYALKTFTLKQYDIVRRDIVQEFAKGNKMSAIKKAGLLAGYLTAANVGTQTIKDIMLGRDPGLDNIPEKSLYALLGVYGFNKYGYDKYIKEGKVTDWAINLVSPALPLLDSVFTLSHEVTEDDPSLGSIVKPVPVVGNIAYNWLLGGAEKYNERMEKERIKEWWEG